MKIERKFGKYFEYSLHDAHIKKIEYTNNNLILYFDYIFSYSADEEKYYKAQIIFENLCIENIEFLIFDTINLEKFNGKSIGLEEYNKSYKNSEYEIIIETYNHGRATFQGWIWTDGNPLHHCIMNIYFNGKMIYDILEEVPFD